MEQIRQLMVMMDDVLPVRDKCLLLGKKNLCRRDYNHNSKSPLNFEYLRYLHENGSLLPWLKYVERKKEKKKVK